MAKIKLVESGYTLIPEGWDIFKIDKVIYKEDFGKMEVYMLTKSGAKHTEKFSLLSKGKEINEGAIKAFSYFAKVALNNFDVEEIDEQDLVGCYIRAKVKHVVSEKLSDKTGKPFINVNLEEKEPALSFKDVKKKDVEVADDDEDDEDSDIDELDDFLDA